MVCVCADFIKITCRVCRNSATETEKNKIKIVHVFGSAFGFGAYVKALIGFKAFYFFGSVSVRFRCICEMALKKKRSVFQVNDVIFNPKKDFLEQCCLGVVSIY